MSRPNSLPSINIFGAAVAAFLRLPQLQIQLFFTIFRMGEVALQDLYEFENFDQELPEFTPLRWFMMIHVLFQILESREIELQNSIAKLIEVEKLSHLLAQACRNLQINNCAFIAHNDGLVRELQSLRNQHELLEASTKKLKIDNNELRHELNTRVFECDNAKRQLQAQALEISELTSNLNQSQHQSYILGEQLNAYTMNGSRSLQYIDLSDTQEENPDELRSTDSVDLTKSAHGYTDPRVIACIADPSDVLPQVTSSSSNGDPDGSTDDDSDLEYYAQKAADQMEEEDGCSVVSALTVD